MTPPDQLSYETLTAIEIATAVAEGSMSGKNVINAAQAIIKQREPEVGAWNYLASPQALASAADENRGGPLAGVPVAIKDILETADMPTANGIVAHEGRQTSQDAVVVERLRAAGAIIVGKTVTTECAFGASGKTSNPHDKMRTPGGSSSGSAASVAAGMVPLAVGSQTAGSIVRPAAYCGVWGMKPSFGVLPRTGMLALAPSFDHPGFFARNAEDLALAFDITSGDDGVDPAVSGFAGTQLRAALAMPVARPRLAFARTFAWDDMDSDAAHRLEQVAQQLQAEELPMGPEFDIVPEAHRVVLMGEATHSLKTIYDAGPAGVSQMLRERIESGMLIDRDTYLTAKCQLDTLRALFRRLLAPFDAIITPATSGEAPVGLAHTGSRNQTMLWSTFGAPAINVPGLNGENGLPLGLQVVGSPGSDGLTLRAAAWVARAIEETAV